MYVYAIPVRQFLADFLLCICYCHLLLLFFNLYYIIIVNYISKLSQVNVINCFVII